MILVDSRIGSADLATPLRAMGLPAELVTLDSGDVAFEGRGIGGKVLSIGIELKKLGDLVSSLRTGRLAEQVSRMLGPDPAYDYAWLLVEGRWSADDQGQLVKLNKRTWKVLPGGMSAAEFQKQILTFELCGGMHVRHCIARPDTLRFIASLYRWFTDKSMDLHRSHLAVHTPVTFLPVSDFRAAIQRFPGIGARTSLVVEQVFGGSLRRAVTASVLEWSEIEVVDGKGKSRRLGMKVAEKIVKFCEGDT